MRAIFRLKAVLQPHSMKAAAMLLLDADAAGKPLAIAVGTDVQNSIYVCRLVEKGPVPDAAALPRPSRLRHFGRRLPRPAVPRLRLGRRHDEVLEPLGVPAQGTDTAGPLGRRVRGPRRATRRRDARPGRPVVPQGPARGRRRRGHPLAGRAPSKSRAANRPRSWRSCRRCPGRRRWFLSTRRNGARPAALPTPPRLAAAGDPVRRHDGEWAFWTPEGYYDASMNGYRLFGWQVNRGLQALPDFYRADQFYQKLERPDVLDRLLPAGSLRRGASRRRPRRRRAAARGPAGANRRHAAGRDPVAVGGRCVRESRRR